MAFNPKIDEQTVSLFLKVLAEWSKLSEKNESIGVRLILNGVRSKIR